MNDPSGKMERSLPNFPGTVLPITHPGRDDFLSLIIAEESFYVPPLVRTQNLSYRLRKWRILNESR